MVVTQITTPDYIGAVLSYLKDQPVVTNLCPKNDITSRVPQFEEGDDGQPPRPWVSIIASPGYTHRYLPIMYPLILVRTYGTTGYRANELWRAVDSALVPPLHVAINGFTRGNCRITGVHLHSTPQQIYDIGWPANLCMYRLEVIKLQVPNE